MTQQMRVQIDLGPDAPIDRVSQVVGDLSLLCQFGGELQRAYERNRAVDAVFNNPDAWIPRTLFFGDSFDGKESPQLAYLIGLPPRLSVGFEVGVSRFLRESNSYEESLSTVTRLEYRNPLDLLIEVGIITYAVYISVRDWTERRRLNRLAVDDYESAVTTRVEVRQHLVDGLASGQYQLTEAQIGELLTPDVAVAFKNIGNALPVIEQLTQGGDDPADAT